MKAKQLAQLLVHKGVLDGAAAKKALASLPRDESLADWLVGQGVVQEVDVLRVLAQASNVRFISSARLSELRVTADALDKLPVAKVQKYDALPVAFDAAKKTLTVAMAEPARVEALDDLPDIARLEQVVAVVALPSVIRAAARRLYGLGNKSKPKAKAPPAGKCSNCQEPYEEDQLECAKCGLLLNPDAPAERTGPSIVRALLSSPTGERRLNLGAAGHEGPTRRGFVLQISDRSVPEITGDLDIVRSLADLEAFLITCVDGMATVGGLSRTSGLMAVEVRSVVASLVERGALRIKPEAEMDDEVTMPNPIMTPEAISIEVVVPPPVPAPLPVLVRKAAPAKPERPTVGRVAVPAPPPVAAPPPSVQEPRLISRAAQDALARLKPAAAKPLPSRGPLEVAPKPYDPTLSKALTMEKRGDIAGAVRLLREGIARVSHPAPIYNRLAVLLLNRQRDAKQASELLHKAVELEPENPVYRQNLLKVLALLA